MEQKQIELIFQIVTMIMMTGISVGFSLSAFWNIKYIRKEKNNPFSWIKLNLAVGSLGMVFIYIYLFCRLFTDNPIAISPFSNFVIRPVILYLSFTIASAARANYIYITKGTKHE